MKIKRESRKNICKNIPKQRYKNYTCFLPRRKTSIAAFWGRFSGKNSDKESRHRVGKISTIQKGVL